MFSPIAIELHIGSSKPVSLRIAHGEIMQYSCADPESFAREANFDNTILIRGKRIQITIKAMMAQLWMLAWWLYDFSGDPD